MKTGSQEFANIALSKAVETNDYNLAQAAFYLGANPNAEGLTHYSVHHNEGTIAFCKKYNFNMEDELCKTPASIKIATYNSPSLLVDIIQQKNIEMLGLFLRNGADINYTQSSAAHCPITEVVGGSEGAKFICQVASEYGHEIPKCIGEFASENYINNNNNFCCPE